MKISVIIPTYNGAHKILNVLKALELQTVKPNEVIVMIDGSTDNTVDVLQQQFSLNNFHVVYQENGGRAHIRNSGVKCATGELLVFFDDDMRPEPNCVEEHLMHHRRYSRSLMTGAAIEDYKNANNDFSKYKCWLSRRWAEDLVLFKDQPIPLENLYLTAANFSITKELFNELRGFDEILSDAEDFDLAVRAYKLGVPIYYNHDAFAWHDDIVSFTQYIKRLREYQQAHIKLREIKPEQYCDMVLRKPQTPRGVKKVIFSLLANKFWIHLADSKYAYFPVRLRHKLYDLVTTAYGTFFTDRAL